MNIVARIRRMAALTEMVVCAVVVASLTGCATNKTLEATGGSRSDGVIELAYEVGGFEVPKIDWTDAQSKAVRRCSAWGYSNAERFGGVKTQCIAFYNGSCVRNTVTVPYQCINK